MSEDTIGRTFAIWTGKITLIRFNKSVFRAMDGFASLAMTW